MYEYIVLVHLFLAYFDIFSTFTVKCYSGKSKNGPKRINELFIH
jgi:hypothetical protein